jgi:hypothetical protein
MRAEIHPVEPVGAAMAEIRQRLENHLGISDPRSASCPTPILDRDLEDWVDLQELTLFDDAAFVREVYRRLLRREPDATGFEHHLHNLRSGRQTKAGLLAQISESEEGRSKKVRLVGLRWLLFQERTASAPEADGNAKALAQERRLERLEGAQFVEAAFHALLKRVPDADAVAQWTRLLETGAVTRGELILALQSTAEAAAAGQRPKRPDSATDRCRELEHLVQELRAMLAYHQDVIHRFLESAVRK